VLSGRNNGSCHLYFKPPANSSIKSRGKFLRGVDLKARNQYVVAPGSRHITGGFYRFSEECSPDEAPLAQLPTFLLEEIVGTQRKAAIPRADEAVGFAMESMVADFPRAGPLRTDAIVLGALRHDAVAAPLYRGQLRFPDDLSRNDIALADKICFYSSHNFDQALRLFLASGLYRDKFMRPINKDWTYAAWTLRRVFLNNPNNWIPKPRKSRRTGAPRGRKPSDLTIAVVLLHHLQPNWTASRIAAELEVAPGTVRQIRHGLRHGRYSDLVRYTIQGTTTQIL
jgi:hypothetical protein